MGEIADMMIDGILDCETGEFIDDEWSRDGGPGFPRTMVNGARSPKSAKIGVVNFLARSHKWINSSDRHQFCVDYLREKGLWDQSHNPSWIKAATMIQEDFSSFASYTNTQKQHHYNDDR